MIRTQTERADVSVTAAIRPTCAADMGALSEFFAGLSPQTRYLRFFAPVTPGPELLRRMSGGDGHADAVVAVREGVIIGHAMAADQADPPGARTADVGVVVADAWQGLGVGSALIRALTTSARARGVTSLTMEVLPGNRKMLAMIASRWPAARIEDSADYVTFRIQLPRRRQRRPQAQPAALAPAA
jgi:ribosomal protein S18 acetylase RimI-like enzyme